jgi:hypothetical protein
MSSSMDPPSYDEKNTGIPAFRPLPENPHALVGVDAPTFPLAVSMYRSLLVELATNHDRRRAMGAAAAVDAATKSWHGAMEMLVDGYREIARPVPLESNNLSLSRTSTIEVDVVLHCAEEDNESVYAESTAAPRRGVGRVLGLGRVFRRSGGRLREGSMSIPGGFLWRRNGEKAVGPWLGRQEGEGGMATMVAKKQSNHVWATRWVIKLAILSFLVYQWAMWMTEIEPLASALSV